MDMTTRKAWVAKGCVDPVVAYRRQAAQAGVRGIRFLLTFAEWWGVWQDHYEERGRHVHQLVMCRTRDEGPYAVGNVRIDSPRSNGQEAAIVRKCAKTNTHTGDAYRPKPPLAGSWLSRRDVFKEYSEDDEESY